jgi:hypothetical protein
MQGIGTAALAVLEGSMETASTKPSALSLLEDREIVAPATVAEARALQAWAERQPAQPDARTSPEELAEQMRYLRSILPSRPTDIDTGKRRVAVYTQILGRYAPESIRRMVEKAAETCRFFPTPAECVAILEAFVSPPTDRDRALSMCQQFWQSRFDDWLAELRDPDASDAVVDAVPEQWRRIAMERGLLRWVEAEERYVIRRKSVGAQP